MESNTSFCNISPNPSIRDAHRRMRSSRIPKCNTTPTSCLDPKIAKLSQVSCKTSPRNMFHRRCVYRTSAERTNSPRDRRPSTMSPRKLVYTSDVSTSHEEGDYLQLKSFIKNEQLRFNCERARFLETEQKMISACSELRQLKIKHVLEIDELNARNNKNIAKLKEYQGHAEQLKEVKNELDSLRATYTKCLANRNFKEESPKGDTSRDKSGRIADPKASSEVAGLKEELQLVRKNFQNSFSKQISELAACENRIATQAQEIVELNQQKSEMNQQMAELNQQIDHLTKELASKNTTNKNQNSIDMRNQLLKIRTELITSMQLKDDATSHQLKTAERLVAQKTNDYLKLLRLFKTTEVELEQHSLDEQHLKDRLEEAHALHTAAEERSTKLTEENDRLKLQFSKIMHCSQF